MFHILLLLPALALPVAFIVITFILIVWLVICSSWQGTHPHVSNRNRVLSSIHQLCLSPAEVLIWSELSHSHSHSRYRYRAAIELQSLLSLYIHSIHTWLVRVQVKFINWQLGKSESSCDCKAANRVNLSEQSDQSKSSSEIVLNIHKHSFVHSWMVMSATATTTGCRCGVGKPYRFHIMQR